MSLNLINPFIKFPPAVGGGNGFVMAGYTGTTNQTIDRFATIADWLVDSNEASNQCPAAHTAVFSDLYVYVFGNTRSVDTFLKFRIAAADGNLVATVTSSTTGTFSDTSNTDSITQADLVNYKLDIPAGTGSVNMKAAGIDTDTVRGILLGGYNGNAVFSGTTLFGTMNWITPTSTENRNHVSAPMAMTLQNLHINVITNSRNADTTFRLRVEGADVNQTITITNSTTGVFADTSNTDSVSQGDKLNYTWITAGSSGSLTLRAASIGNAINENGFNVYGYHNNALLTADSFYNLSGILQNTTENNALSPAPNSMTVENITVYTDTNTRNSTTNYKLRVNKADGNNSASITASTTGTFTDTSNSDSVSADDDLNSQVDITSGTGSIRTTGAGFQRTA